MTIQLLKPIAARAGIIPAGTIIKIDSPEVGARIIREGVGRLIDPAGTMDETLRQTITDIEAGRMWQVTPEVREIEDAIDQTYVEVLAGAKSIEDFEAIVVTWKIAGTQGRRLN